MAKKKIDNSKITTVKTNESSKSKALRWVVDIIVIVIASVIYSLGLHVFTVPNDIAAGGVGGISTIIHELFDINVGLMYGLINVPLVIVGFIFLGKNLMIKTLISVVVITFSTDYLLLNFPVYENGDKVVASIFGGVLMGAGLGITFLREGTSGGTDITNKIINKFVPHFSMGAITMATDVVIVGASVLVFNNIENGLYAVISIFVCSKVIDMFLYGTFEGKMLLIFSDRYQEIADIIMIEFDRGVTFLLAKGAYSGADKNVICCAVHKNEYAKIKRKVKVIDPKAFIIISNTGEVLGDGFQENS